MTDLAIFQKPQRYVGNEWNVVKKTHHKKIPICVSYPNLYEIGMSNLGLRIIYSMLNDFEDVACERVFMPGNDLTEFLLKNKAKLFSLETKTPLSEFEVLGFNFDCELNFVNFLRILELGGIALEASKRDDIIVLGGGIANPEPIAEFVDLFYLGEFEEGAVNFIEILRKYKDKRSRLKALSEIDGFYVPSFYNVDFNTNVYKFEKVYPNANFPLKRGIVKNLNKSYYPLKWLTPHTQIIHDRVPMEIARGCPNNCTFCQARAIYYPYREKSIETVCEQVEKIYKNSGYENFSLLALSASNYSAIDKLIDALLKGFKEKSIGLSLPSLRVDDIIGKLYTKLFFLKKTSLTVAIEAAQEGLRNKLGKTLDINKLFEAAKILRSLKLKQIKLYFLTGFSEEADEDLISIGTFLQKLSQETRIGLNVSVNIFVPKPFSLWETHMMDREETLVRKIKIISSNIPRRGNINLSISQPRKSILEAIISRADRRFSSVILEVFRVCQKQENDYFDWDIWQAAMQKLKIDYKKYLNNIEYKNFPWSFIARPDKLCEDFS